MYRIGLENITLLGQEYRDEIKEIHNSLMRLELDREGVDMDVIFADVDKYEPERKKFFGQWNRVVRFIAIYEGMFGQDPTVLTEAEAWAKKQLETAHNKEIKKDEYDVRHLEITDKDGNDLKVVKMRVVKTERGIEIVGLEERVDGKTVPIAFRVAQTFETREDAETELAKIVSKLKPRTGGTL